MTKLEDLTREDLDLMRNALCVWRDSRIWRYGDHAFCDRLKDVANKIWDITNGDDADVE